MKRKVELILAASTSRWEKLASAFVEAGFSVLELARAQSLSARQLERKLRLTFGQTPRQIANELRMTIAAQWLRSGKSVKETASDLAYFDASHFSKAFKAFYGMSPCKWRNVQGSALAPGAELPLRNDLKMADMINTRSARRPLRQCGGT
jgi:AraC-like DNA-binding protein